MVRVPVSGVGSGSGLGIESRRGTVRVKTREAARVFGLVLE